MAKEKNSSDKPSSTRRTAPKRPDKAAAPKAEAAPASPESPKASKSPAKKAAPRKKAIAVAAGAESTPNLRQHPPAALLHEEIRLRAWEIYCERGGHHGQHEDDWHRAEREVRARYK
jgi:hypothetical protein